MTDEKVVMTPMPTVTGRVDLDPDDLDLDEVAAQVAAAAEAVAEERPVSAHDLTSTPAYHDLDTDPHRAEALALLERARANGADSKTPAEQMASASRELVPVAAGFIEVTVRVPVEYAAAICQQRHGEARADQASLLDVREAVADHLTGSLYVHPSTDAWMHRIEQITGEGL